MIYALLGGFVAGAAAGAWGCYMIMRSSSSAPAAGGPQDPAVVAAVATAGAPAEVAAAAAAEEIANAPDAVVDARASELMRRADENK